MSSFTRLTTKGQVVIPKALRDRLRWRPGTRLAVRLLPEGGLALDAPAATAAEGAKRDPIDRAYGALRGCRTDILAELEEDHRAELDDDGA